MKCVACNEPIEGERWDILRGDFWHLGGDCGTLRRKFLAREVDTALVAADLNPQIWKKLAQKYEEKNDAES